jgi:hypothetical protein
MSLRKSGVSEGDMGAILDCLIQHIKTDGKYQKYWHLHKMFVTTNAAHAVEKGGARQRYCNQDAVGRTMARWLHLPPHQFRY